ncbi:MAG: hypothetical protein ACRDF8_12670, partial [Chloroflexota bacterium]
VVFNNAIYGVPVSFPIVPGGVLWVHQDSLDAAGVGRPTSGADFKQILEKLKKPNQNFYGIGSFVANAAGTGGAYDLPWYAMMHQAPNNWRADAAGKLTKNFETPEYKAAISYLHDLVASGVFAPDATTNNVLSVRSAFQVRKYAFDVSGWLAAANQFWAAALSLKPPSTLGLVAPFGVNGGKGSFYTGQQLFGFSVLKKASDARIKELLGIMNFLAAPFGTTEQLLLNYGVEGTDFTFDSGGNPMLTTRGKTDTNSLWGYITAPPQVYYNPASPKQFATMMQTGEKAYVNVAVADPTGTLYSATNASKGPVISRTLLNGVGDILAGRRPLADYDGLLKDWKAAGGDQIRTEFEQALAAAK